MPPNPDRLYELLPVIHRQRDAEQGYPLQALLRVIAEQVNLVEADMAQLYENWFIETAQAWAVPYIGDLIGYTPVHEAGEPGDPATTAGQARNKILIPRRAVANTLRYRRRKGTLAVLEELARTVAGWPARAVEFYTLLNWMQNINLPHTERHRTVNLREGHALDLLNGPFDSSAHTVDVRRINSARTPGRYNLPSVGLFVWRLKAYSVTRTQAYCIEEEGPHCYTFSPLGNDAPLFAKPEPEPEPDPSHIADEVNVPTPIRRRAIQDNLTAYYGEDKSLAVWVAGQLISADDVIVADLTRWFYHPSSGKIAFDPVLGRLAFPPGKAPRQEVRVSYHSGFSANLGGGEYHRPLTQHAEAKIINVSGPDDLRHALMPWTPTKQNLECADQPPKAMIEIGDSDVYVLPIQLRLNAGCHLQIRAANGRRPILRLLDYQTSQPDALTATLLPGSHLTLDGLLVTGRPVHIRTDEHPRAQREPCPAQFTIRHCTLTPGWSLNDACEPQRPLEPSLELYNFHGRVRVEHSILGSIQVSQNEVTRDPLPLHLSDSILDATEGDDVALSAPGGEVAHAVLTIRRCTVFGMALVHAIELAENTIFNDCLHVARRQLGCLRFCYVPAGCRTPRRYHCQPDLAEQNLTAEADKIRARERVRPRFTDRRYGRPGYGQLAETCAAEIQRGADDASELGAFHDLYQPQRAANLRARLDEYTPAGLNAGIIFVS